MLRWSRRSPLHLLLTCSLATSTRTFLFSKELATSTLTRTFTLQHANIRSLATRSEIAAAAAAAASAKTSVNTSSSSSSSLSNQMRDENELLINALLTRIEKGIQDGDLEKKNKGFTIKRERSMLTIDTGPFARSGGTVFTIEADSQSLEPRVSMTSLKNSGQGYLHYKYDKRSGHWINESDSHFLLELLVRDLTHHCAGFPVL